MDHITFALLGTFVGFVSHFFGIGGGSIIVPILLWLKPEWGHPHIVFLSLLVVFINALNNIRIAKFIQKVPFQLKAIMLLSIGVLVGGSLGGNFVQLISPYYLKIILSILLILSALKIFRKKQETNKKWPVALGFPLGVVAGLIASLTGLGGGMLFIPILITIYKLNFKHIPAHSNALMLMSSSSALLSQTLSSKESLPWDNFSYALVLLIIFSFLGSFISTKIDLNLSQNSKKISLACLLLLLAFRTILTL